MLRKAVAVAYKGQAKARQGKNEIFVVTLIKTTLLVLKASTLLLLGRQYLTYYNHSSF